MFEGRAKKKKWCSIKVVLTNNGEAPLELIERTSTATGIDGRSHTEKGGYDVRKLAPGQSTTVRYACTAPEPSYTGQWSLSGVVQDVPSGQRQDWSVSGSCP
jgi:hypothetical protein